jgi:hypothetical protein
MIDWLENWYSENCDGNWEHDFGIKINTLDNPGWEVIIDLTDTGKILPDEEWRMFEINSNDWYGYKIKNNTFNAAGDPKKLNLLLNLFREKVSLL